MPPAIKEMVTNEAIFEGESWPIQPSFHAMATNAKAGKTIRGQRGAFSSKILVMRSMADFNMPFRSRRASDYCAQMEVEVE
jgi:hypothetical protein